VDIDQYKLVNFFLNKLKDKIMFNPQNKTITGILSISFTTLLIIIWISGCFHMKKKHKDDLLADSVFSQFYYGIEQFWHKTDKDDLNKIVNKAIYAMTLNSISTNESEIEDYNKLKEKILNSLKDLKDDHINYVHNGVKNFIKFDNSYRQDINDGIIEFKKTGKKSFVYSETTNLLADACFKYNLENYLKIAKENFDKYNNENLSFKLEIMDKNISELENFLYMDHTNKATTLYINYKNLFNLKEI
jgi:hypothetical protein